MRKQTRQGTPAVEIHRRSRRFVPTSLISLGINCCARVLFPFSLLFRVRARPEFSVEPIHDGKFAICFLGATEPFQSQAELIMGI